MVKIGVNVESFTLCDHSGFIQLSTPASTLVFQGPFKMSVNGKLRICGDGEIRIGKYVCLGSNARLICNGSKITIGDYTRFAFDVNVIDSGFHHVYNSTKKCFGRSTRPIYLGNNCWLGNRVSITAGSKLKPFTIVGTGSMVNKDFTKSEEENQMLGGCPAKIIGSGFKRIFSPQYEEKVSKWFKEHQTESVYLVDDFIDNVEDITSEF